MRRFSRRRIALYARSFVLESQFRSNTHDIRTSSMSIVEVIRCIKKENAWIKCKIENIYLIEKCNNK